MRCFLIFLIAIFASCTRRSNIKTIQKEPEDSISFFWTYKDSVTILKFGFNREKMQYSCTDPRESFTLFYDSVQQKWLFKDRVDSCTMYVEKEDGYNENGTWYHVSKLILDKGVTDGEVTYVVEKKAGLLARKSNTWRYAMFRKTDDAHLAAIMYRVISDRDFYDNDTAGMRQNLK